MAFRLGCPNCGNQIEVSATAEDRMITCDGCHRSYRVPPLPQQSAHHDSRPSATETGRYRSSRSRQTRFNLIVSGVATVTVVLSVAGMLWLRGENFVHGDTGPNDAGTTAVETETAEAETTWNVDNLLADFPPIRPGDLDQFAGDYVVVGDLTAAQRHVFGAPAKGSPAPQQVSVTCHRLSTETVNLSFSDTEANLNWAEQLAPTSVRLGHGFHLVNSFRPALTILGAYSVEDFRDFNVYCSVDSHRFIEGDIVVTQACLTKEEFEKKIPLRDRNHLCRVVSTYSIDEDTIRITKRASGSDRDLTRRFAAMLQARTINSRRLIAQELADLEQAWLEGQTLTLKRVVSPQPEKQS